MPRLLDEHICEDKAEALRTLVLVVPGIILRCKKEKRRLTDQENILVLRHIYDCDKCIKLLREGKG